MSNQDLRDARKGAALAHEFSKQHLRSALAMFVSAALAFGVTWLVLPQLSGLALGMAAATGFSVGVWCQPDVYRSRNGSLTWAIALIAAMWAVPFLVMLISAAG